MRFNLKTLAVTLKIVTLTVPLSAYAAFSNPGVEIAEMMMQAQQSDAAYIGSMFGANAATTLAFNSTLDVANKQFNYSLISGSTYQGKDISLAVSGAFDQADNTWKWTSNGSRDGISWQGKGDTIITGDPLGDGNFNVDLGVFRLQNHVEYSEGPLTTGSTSTGSLSIFGSPVLTFSGSDRFNINTGEFDWFFATSKIHFGGAGFTNIPGAGNFNIQISPVPEPSITLLLGTGASALISFRRRVSKKQNPTLAI